MGCSSSTPASNPSGGPPRKKGGKKLILGYLNMRGGCRGNVARFMLAASGADWEEKTYVRGQPEWGQDKPTLMPFANLPYIIDGDHKISETFAVHQYIAGKYCPTMLGTTPQERARAYQLQCIGNETVINYTKMCFGTDNPAAVSKVCLEGLKKLGSLLDDGRQFLTGAKPVIADFILFEHINFANKVTGEQTWQMCPNPKLEAFYQRMGNLPGLKEYLQTPAFKAVANTWIPSPPAKLDVNNIMPKNKVTDKAILGYFNMRGGCRGNVARFLLASSGASWEEKTYVRGQPEWGQDKPTIMPFANLPYIICGEAKISETFAVHQYIAGKYCPTMLGTTPQERARNYQLQCIGNETVVNFTKMCFATDDAAAVAKKCLDGLNVLGKNLNDGRQFLTGANPVIADFILFEHINFANQVTAGKTFEQAPNPKLEAFFQRMNNLSGLKEYLQTPDFKAIAGTWIPSPPAKLDVNNIR